MTTIKQALVVCIRIVSNPKSIEKYKGIIRNVLLHNQDLLLRPLLASDRSDGDGGFGRSVPYRQAKWNYSYTKGVLKRGDLNDFLSV